MPFPLPPGATPATSGAASSSGTGTQQFPLPAGATPVNAGQPSDVQQGYADANTDIKGFIKKQLPTSISGIPSAIWHASPAGQITDQVKQVFPLIDAYEKARSSGSSIIDSVKAADATARQHLSNILPVQGVVDAFKANPTRETARALVDATTAAGVLLLGGEGADAEAGTTSAGVPATTAAAIPTTAAETVSPEVEAATARLKPTNPFRARIQARLQAATASPEAAGEAVSQPATQAGLRATAPPVGESFRSGMDVATPLGKAKGLYRQIDDASGTNFQELYEKLDAAQDDARLAAPGSPEEAKAQLNVKNTQDAIDDAKVKAKESGVADVDAQLDAADAKYTEAQANKDFNSRIYGNQGLLKGNVAHGAEETFDTNKLIDAVENMDKPNKYGVSRLQQTTLGPKGAAELKQYLYDAQKAGETAMDAREFRNKLVTLGLTGVGIAGGVAGGVYELTKSR